MLELNDLRKLNDGEGIKIGIMDEGFSFHWHSPAYESLGVHKAQPPS
mgnify:CR=1 FL=1